ncbi:MAG: methyltransferase [Acidobacteria bacterium]|nr:methyltransferase [Acidobacteriota bacterium]
MKTADYGIDKPDRVRALAMVGLVLIGTGLSQFIALQGAVDVWPELILFICLWIGVLMMLVAGIMLWSSKSGKGNLSGQMVDKLNWRGREKVLDVGCGRGLLTILAARKAPLGEMVGIDVWSQEQLSENTKEAAMENAEAERVADRVRFED